MCQEDESFHPAYIALIHITDDLEETVRIEKKTIIIIA